MTPQDSGIEKELHLDLDEGGFQEEEENVDEERWEPPHFTYHFTLDVRSTYVL